MAVKVDLYNNAYGSYELEAHRRVRLETYGQDFGQTSWVTNEESNEIPKLLELTRDSNVLEIGSGSGRYAIHVAQQTGCRITGVEINPHGVRNANRLAAEAGLTSVRFQECDVSQGLPFENGAFDAVFANDVLCHIRGRAAVFAEIYRVVKQGGRFLFSDALVIGGTVTEQEIAERSSIGHYEFSPPGENERLLKAARFAVLSVTETSNSAAEISGRRRDARARYKDELIAAEGAENFEGLQRFLNCVQRLCSEKRLLRFLYLVGKEPEPVPSRKLEGRVSSPPLKHSGCIFG